jgi:iron complex transport system substrate-binding protein
MQSRRGWTVRHLGLVVLAAASIGTVAGCGSDDSSSTTGTEAAAATTTEAAATGFPVSIKSALGTAEIKAAPERVVTVGWGSQDAALALGVVPVGMQDFSSDCGCKDGILPWDREQIDELGGETPTLIGPTSDELPYEKIASLQPDVILATYSGLTADQYEKLAQIAPVVGYPDKPWITSWQDQIKLVGEALGKSDEAAALTKQTDERIAAAAKAHPEFQGKTIAFGSGTKPGAFNFYYDDDSRVELLTQLGFSPSPDVTRLGDGGSAASFAKEVSLELLPDIKTDVLVSWYLNPTTQKAIQGSKVFQGLPYVKDDAYVPITDPPLVYATSAVNVLSLPWMLDQYLPLLSKAADNVKS